MELNERLLCVLIAGEYSNVMFPFSTPLLKIANTPMIEYSLELLNKNGFQDVIIFCEKDSHIKNLVNAGIEESRTWSIDMNIQVITLEECRHMNQALCDLYARSLIRGNFILLEVNTICNIDLQHLFSTHGKYNKEDKHAIMTVAYKKIPAFQKTDDEVITISDKHSHRLLYHKKMGKKISKISFPLEIFSTHQNVVLHHNQISATIAVCSNTSLTLFIDNYDYTTLDMFIQGVLDNEELLGSRIYMMELQDNEYAIKVSNWQAFQFVNQDMLGRWAYSLIINNSISMLQQQFSFYHNMVYKSNRSHLEFSQCHLHNVIIDKASIVNSKSFIGNTVVGKRCKIGEMCNLNYVYIFDDALLANNVIANHAIVGRNVNIGENCVLDHGTVIGDNTELPAGSNLCNAVITSAPITTEWNLAFKKIGDKAYIVTNNENEHDLEDDENENLVTTPISSRKMSQYQQYYSSSVNNSSNDDDEEEMSVEGYEEDVDKFKNEVFESMKRAYETNMELQHLLVEINGSRFAHNVSLSEVAVNVVKGLTMMSNAVEEFQKLFKYFCPIFKNYIKDMPEMNHCLLTLQESFKECSTLNEKAGHIVHLFYMEDIIFEEAIIAWYGELEDDLKSRSLKKLYKWLKESSEEESD